MGGLPTQAFSRVDGLRVRVEGNLGLELGSENPGGVWGLGSHGEFFLNKPLDTSEVLGVQRLSRPGPGGSVHECFPERSRGVRRITGASIP